VSRKFLWDAASERDFTTNNNHQRKTMNSQAQFSTWSHFLALLTLVCSSAPSLLRAQCCGNLDTSFNPFYAANNTVYASVRQSDGKVIIGGAFTSYEQSARNYIARLTASGGNDASYSGWVNGTIYGMALDTSDGTDRVVAVGSFSYANMYTPVSGLTRFLANGSHDPTFTCPSIDYYPTAVAVQPDGKILIGGYHNYVAGYYYRPRIARLNANGTVDTSFNAGNIDGGVFAIKVVGFNGSMFIGGSFTTVGGTGRGRLAKLTSTGSIDNSLGFGNANGTVYAIDTPGTSLSDGILIGGEFTQVNGQSIPYLASLDYNGIAAGSSTPPNGTVRALKLIPDANGFVIGGDFTMVGTDTSQGFARYDGFAASCVAGTGFTGGAPTSVRTISLLTQFPDRAFCGGAFTAYKGTPRYRVAQIFLECD
jgi:uncharacterized delta-60 repeat protein